jgi:large subunit ribosomal protein L6
MLSRIAKLPITIPDNVEVTVNGSHVKVKGPLGLLEFVFDSIVGITKEGNTIVLSTANDTKFAKAMSGTVCAMIKNMIHGVCSGFEKKLTILGVGYRANMEGSNLNLALGYSHPVLVKAPLGIKFATPTQTEIIVSGLDKQLVGQMAAVIREHRPVEPYKGKGVRYANERVVLKETKKK